MGIINQITKVMPLGFPSTSSLVSSLCIFTFLILHIVALQCPPGIQYWDAERDTCIDCTKCNELGAKDSIDYVVLKPCEVHRDTLCGPISVLSDWLKLSSEPRQHHPKQKIQQQHRHHRHNGHNVAAHVESYDNRDGVEGSSNSGSTTERHHHGHHHQRNKHHHHNRNRHNGAREQHGSTIAGATSTNVAKSPSGSDRNVNDELLTSRRFDWNYAKTANDNIISNHDGLHSDKDISDNNYVMNDGGNNNNVVQTNLIHSSNSGGRGGNSAVDVVNERLVWPSDQTPFTNVETLVWDWQAVVLAMAVCACILFFVVAAAYSVHHARQWKRLKENFEADVEELSARLNLMVASGDISENLEPNFHSPINDGNYHNNRCAYLEQLLVRKDTKLEAKRVDNVYIEEKNGAASNGGATTTEKITND